MVMWRTFIDQHTRSSHDLKEVSYILYEHLEEDCFKGFPLSFGSSTTLLLSVLLSNRGRVPKQARAKIMCEGYEGVHPHTK